MLLVPLIWRSPPRAYPAKITPVPHQVNCGNLRERAGNGGKWREIKISIFGKLMCLQMISTASLSKIKLNANQLGRSLTNKANKQPNKPS